MNKGIAPVDLETDIGLVRSEVGDVVFTPIPDEPGYGDFGWLSDVEIDGLLRVGRGSILRATGYAFRKIAAHLTMTGGSIKTNDLAVNNTNRGKDLFEIAQSYLSDADLEDSQAIGDIFEIAPGPELFGRGCSRPEAACFPTYCTC